MSLSRVNNYWHDKRQMDDDAVIACCELLEWDTQKYVAMHRGELAKTEREISFWKRAANAAALILLMGTFPTPGHASDKTERAGSDSISRNTAPTAYYVN